MAATRISLPGLSTDSSNAALAARDEVNTLSLTITPEFRAHHLGSGVKLETSDLPTFDLTVVDVSTSLIEADTTVTSVVEATKTITATETASPTASTVIGDGSGLSSAETLSATNTGDSRLSTSVDAQSSHVNTEIPRFPSSTGWNSSPQQASNLPLGPLIGGTLGGLGMLLVGILALTWMSYQRRGDDGSSKAQPVELENANTADQDSSAQVEPNHVKPELSAASPAVLPSLTSQRFGQEELISSREEVVGTRYELPTGFY